MRRRTDAVAKRTQREKRAMKIPPETTEIHGTHSAQRGRKHPDAQSGPLTDAEPDESDFTSEEEAEQDDPGTP